MKHGNEASLWRTSCGKKAILRSKASEGPAKPWAITPVDIGCPFLVPPERWREIEDEGRVP